MLRPATVLVNHLTEGWLGHKEGFLGVAGVLVLSLSVVYMGHVYSL